MVLGRRRRAEGVPRAVVTTVYARKESHLHGDVEAAVHDCGVRAYSGLVVKGVEGLAGPFAFGVGLVEISADVGGRLARLHRVAFTVAVFFSSRRRHTRFGCDWSSDVCSSDLNKSLASCRLFDRHPSTSTFGNSHRRALTTPAGRWRTWKRPRLSATNATKRRSVKAADRKSTRLNSSHRQKSYAAFCFQKKNTH